MIDPAYETRKRAALKAAADYVDQCIIQGMQPRDVIVGFMVTMTAKLPPHPDNTKLLVAGIGMAKATNAELRAAFDDMIAKRIGG